MKIYLMAVVAMQIVLILVMIFIMSTFINQNELPFTNKQAIRAVIGEASNQDFDTMLCISHAIRNRKTLRGVYGVSADRDETDYNKDRAKRAWYASSIGEDKIHGATEWRSTDEMTSAVLSKSKDLVKCGDFYFFKLKGK